MRTRCNKQEGIFIGAIALVHALFFLMACRYTRIFMGDSFEYIYEAFNIKDHFFFYSGNPALPVNPEMLTQRQPLYPLLLLSVYWFTVNNWVVLVLQNILSLINIVYVRRVLLSSGGSRRFDWLLILLLVAYPAQFINANTIAPDILLQTCCVFYFGNFMQLHQARTVRSALFMSFWLIAGLFVKPVLYPFVAVHGVLMLAYGRSWRFNGPRILLIALLPLLAVLAYNYDNFIRTGKFHFSSNQAFNAIYYFYAFDAHTRGADSAAHFLQRERATLAEIPAFKDRYDAANREGITLLRANFIPYMLFHLENSGRLLMEPGKAEMDLFTGRLTYGRLYSKVQAGFYTMWKTQGIAGLRGYLADNHSMPFVIVVLLFNVLRLVGLGLFFFLKRVPLDVRVFIFIFISYFAVVTGPIANTRYFLPVSLIAIGCAAIGWEGFMSNRLSKRGASPIA